MSASVPPFGRLLGARDAGIYLGVTTSKMRKLIARGEVVALRNAKGRLEGVYEKDLDDWIARRRLATVPAARSVGVDERMKALMPSKRVFG